MRNDRDELASRLSRRFHRQDILKLLLGREATSSSGSLAEAPDRGVLDHWNAAGDHAFTHDLHGLGCMPAHKVFDASTASIVPLARIPTRSQIISTSEMM